MSDKSSRPTSVSTSTSSLMQDVPGAFPAPPQFGDNNEYDHEDGDNEVTFKSLSQAVYARRAEYVRPKHVRIKIGTWNVAACKGVEKDIGGWFVGGKGLADQLTGARTSERRHNAEDVVQQEARYERKEETLPKGDVDTLPSGEDVGLYVLGLQEVVDITAFGPAVMPTDTGVASSWKEAMESALPRGYQLVAEQQLIGLLLFIYAAPDVAKEVKSVSTTSVGTGLLGYMGNKGAVTARLVLGETTRLVFVNSHLAAGADKAALERRIWDSQQIISRTRFEPIQDAMDLEQKSGEVIGDEDFAFWCGDLNFRLEGIPGDDVRRLLMLHTRKEYDLSQRSLKIEEEVQQATDAVHERLSLDDTSSARSDVSRADTLVDEITAGDDPASLQATLNSLLPHDELHQQMKARKAFHDGWREGPITFLPTYKYDIGSVGVFDSSEKKRAPSWCDRIIYRTRKDKLTYENKIREEESARKKDEEMKASGTDQAGNDEEILYDYDPDADGDDTGDYDEYDETADATGDGVVVTREGFEDVIQLEYYTAHQRVLSSDHKPLESSFMLKYDAVVPELKAKIHAEVARELDRAENEGRPNVTVVPDRNEHTTPSASDVNLPGGRSDEGVWFGDIRWMHRKYRSLTVANTSRVSSTFNFIERPVDESQVSGIAPQWLSLKIDGAEAVNTSPASQSVILEPGDTSHIEMELKISSPDDVRKLNVNNKSEIDDILVLRVENGRDHFIPIRGRWLESSLNRTVDALCRIPEGGIRRLQGQKPSYRKAKQAATAVKAANAFGDNLLPDSADASGENEPPVRFSAPRELFRLTEVVEELSTRVVAEWEMLYDVPPMTPISPGSLSARSSIESRSVSAEVPRAPWNDNAAWPFDEECWTERTTPAWDEALSAACNALDEDESLERSLPDEMPRIERLYVLSNLLLIFLRSMPDGIITTTLWTAVEQYLTDTVDKSKRKPSIDGQRTAIQEILSQSQSHSISFTLITSMLERMIQEITGASRARDDAASIVATPMSPGKKAVGGFKRAFRGKSAAATTPAGQRDMATKALAKIFAGAMIRSEEVGSEKARGAVEKRKVDVVEVFLKRHEPR